MPPTSPNSSIRDGLCALPVTGSFALCECCGDTESPTSRSSILSMHVCQDCRDRFAGCSRCGASADDAEVAECDEVLLHAPRLCMDCREEVAFEVFGSRDGWLLLGWEYHGPDECRGEDR